MDRAEFMRRLEQLLQEISSAERKEALQYYNDYFDDAGIENEQEVIRALGSPERVAANIKSGLAESGIVPVRQEGGAGGTYSRNEAGQAWQKEEKRQLSGGMIALIVVLCILAAPIVLPLAVGILGLLLGLLAAWFGLIFGFAVAAVCLLGALVILMVIGFSCIAVEPLVGAALIGAGLICGSIGILFLMLAVVMTGVATPAVFKGIGWLMRACCGK